MTRRPGAVDFKAGMSAGEIAGLLTDAFDGFSELSRIEIHGIAVAARDQVVLDAYGGVDRMAEQADILLGRRVA